MYLRVEFIINVKIDLIVVAVTTALRRSLAASAGHFWQPEKSENVANPDFENLKHL